MPRFAAHAAFALALALAFAACGSSSDARAGAEDAGTRSPDAGGAPDAAAPDAGDAPPPDAGPPDAGPPPWWTERERDHDGDFWDKEDGDCDDLDPSVHPENADACNGRDDDCDGRIDEDFDGDRGEPENGAPLDLGDLSYASGKLIDAYLFPATDVDRYRLRVDDVALRDFDLEAWVYGVPEDADFVVELKLVLGSEDLPAGSIEIADALGPGGYEFVNYSGDVTRDDSGVYEIEVRSKSGAGCVFPYQLQILVGGT